MKKYEIVITDCVTYRIIADDKAFAIKQALKYWAERMPIIRTQLVEEEEEEE